MSLLRLSTIVAGGALLLGVGRYVWIGRQGEDAAGVGAAAESALAVSRLKQRVEELELRQGVVRTPEIGVAEVANLERRLASLEANSTASAAPPSPSVAERIPLNEKVAAMTTLLIEQRRSEPHDEKSTRAVRQSLDQVVAQSTELKGTRIEGLECVASSCLAQISPAAGQTFSSVQPALIFALSDLVGESAFVTDASTGRVSWYLGLRGHNLPWLSE